MTIVSDACKHISRVKRIVVSNKTALSGLERDTYENVDNNYR